MGRGLRGNGNGWVGGGGEEEEGPEEAAEPQQGAAFSQGPQTEALSKRQRQRR